MKTATERAVRLAVEGGWAERYIRGEKIHSIKVKNLCTPINSLLRGKRLRWADTITIDFKHSEVNLPLYEALMDKDFWRFLGMRLGWGTDEKNSWDERTWASYWHSLIDHLADGGTTEQFFKTLLAGVGE